jgi:ATP-dependent Clp protease adaptor protein ClpS
MPGKRPDSEHGTQTIERQDLEPPRMFKVLLHNDNYTTMEFVVQVLMGVFVKPRDEAVQIMLSVHHNGLGLCGLYPCEIAETKVEVVHKLAADNGFPLKCSMEPE